MSDRLLHPPLYLGGAEPLLSEEDISEEEGFNISPSSQSSNSLSRSPSPPHSHDVNRPSRGSISIEMNADDRPIPLLRMTRSQKEAKRRYDNRNKTRKNGRFITAVGSSRSRTFLSIITIAYLVLVPTVIHFASPPYNHFDFWCAETTWPVLRIVWEALLVLTVLAASKHSFRRYYAGILQQEDWRPLGAEVSEDPYGPAETLEERNEHRQYRDEWRQAKIIHMGLVGSLFLLYISMLDWNLCEYHRHS